MTIDLTGPENAGWMSFTAKEMGFTADRRDRLLVQRGNIAYAIVAIDTDDQGYPADVDVLHREEHVSDGWVDAMDDYLWEHILTRAPDTESADDR